MSNPFLTLGGAAKATGKNKTTIYRAIKSGRLSGNYVDGEYQIDPVELFRVFEPLHVTDGATAKSNDAQFDVTIAAQPSETLKMALELGGLRAEVRTLQSTVDDLRRDKDDLRARLDKEGEERRKLTLMLTHQATQEPIAKESESRLMVWLVMLLVVASVGAVLALRLGFFT